MPVLLDPNGVMKMQDSGYESYAWELTKGFLETVYKSTICGPRRADPKLLENIEKTGKKFKMFDDDGELYYEGYITGDYTGFEPLDDYGGPNAGCTYIQYQNETTKEWETL